MKKFNPILMLILSLLVMVGCSSTDKGDTGKSHTDNSIAKEEKQQKSTLIDVEELLPKEEVEKVLGIEIKNNKHSDTENLGMSGMNYYNKDKEKCVWIHCFQQPAVPKGDDFDVKKRYHENYEISVKHNNAETIENLGDEAYYNKMSHTVNVLFEDYYFTLKDSLSNAFSDEKKEMELKLAKIVVKNLKKKLGK